MTPLETLLTRPPLQRRQAAISLIESLMSESDDAFDIHSAAFDALDDPATKQVFGASQVVMPTFTHEGTYGEFRG